MIITLSFHSRNKKGRELTRPFPEDSENKKTGGPLSALGFRLIYFIPASTSTNGRQAKIIAPPKVKAVSGIILHGILLQISGPEVKKKIRRNRAFRFTAGGKVTFCGKNQRITKAKRK
jgi:hypothetical protein